MPDSGSVEMREYYNENDLTKILTTHGDAQRQTVISSRLKLIQFTKPENPLVEVVNIYTQKELTVMQMPLAELYYKWVDTAIHLDHIPFDGDLISLTALIIREIDQRLSVEIEL